MTQRGFPLLGSLHGNLSILPSSCRELEKPFAKSSYLAVTCNANVALKFFDGAEPCGISRSSFFLGIYAIDYVGLTCGIKRDSSITAGITCDIMFFDVRCRGLRIDRELIHHNSDMLAGAILALIVGCLIWAYQAMKAPPPKICLSKDCSSITSLRIRLSVGRYLAYKIRGAAKESARHHVILSHGFCCSKDTYIPLSDEWLAEHGICLIAFDRPGYAESDPNPNRSPKSDAKDIEELADALDLGPKLYVIGLSMGNYPVWGCLKYIPHRLAGVALVVPVVNYWWPSLPRELCSPVFNKLDFAERCRLRILHHAPKLAWMLRSWLPWPTVHSMLKKNPRAFNKSDMRIMNFLWNLPAPDTDKIQQQGDYVSLHQDMKVSFGKWEFDPLNIDNPFLDNKGQAHLWIGDEDGVISPELQRYILRKLAWIRCHEVPGGGHSIVHDIAICEMIFKSLCLENN